MEETVAKNSYQVFLTAEALEVLSRELVGAFIDRHGFPHLDCRSIDPDGQYLHVVAAKPVLALKLPDVDFLIPHHFVLYISSGTEKESPGFEEYLAVAIQVSRKPLSNR